METGSDLCLISDGIQLAMLKAKLGAGGNCQKYLPCASKVQLSPWCLEMWSKNKWSTFMLDIASQVTRLAA